MESDDLRELARNLPDDSDGKKKKGLIAAADELDRLAREVQEKESYRRDGSFLRMG